jgi:hypothetical protein
VIMEEVKKHEKFNNQINKEKTYSNSNNQEKKSKENQSWWEERLEELSKGMEKTALRL